MKALETLEQSGPRQADVGSSKSTYYLRCGIRWGLRVLVSIVVLGSLMTTCAFAQMAQLSGLITDSTGASIPKATVTTLNENTGISRATESNRDGFYSAPLLQPGNYTITVSA